MFTSNEYMWYNDRWYNEMDEEKRVVQTAAHIVRQDIHGMDYNR